MNAIERLQSQKVPVKSFVAAIEFLKERPMTVEDYRAEFFSLSGHSLDVTDDHVPYHYMYLVQETIRSYNATGKLDMNEIITVATSKASEFIRKNAWIFAKPDDYRSTSLSAPKLDAAGNPKKPKGAKRDMAVALWNKHKGSNMTRKEWIDLLCKEVGLTPAGASTYHANLKSGAYK